MKNKIMHSDLAAAANRSYDTCTFSTGDCEALIEMHNQHQVIAIRGTEGGKLLTGLGFMDVIRDMRFIPWYDKKLGWAHSGFLHGGLDIFEEIGENLDPDIPIIVTGHSLGAALALIVSILLKQAGYNVVEYVGFACPRTFVYNKQKHNKDSSVRFPMTIYRYENDIVPILPLSFPFGYHHPVEMTQLGYGDGLPSILDHSMSNYEEAINKIKS